MLLSREFCAAPSSSSTPPSLQILDLLPGLVPLADSLQYVALDIPYRLALRDVPTYTNISILHAARRADITPHCHLLYHLRFMAYLMVGLILLPTQVTHSLVLFV